MTAAVALETEAIYPAFAVAEEVPGVEYAVNPDMEAPLKHRFLNPKITLDALRLWRGRYSRQRLTLALIPDSTGQPKVVFRGGPSAWSQTEEGYEDFCASLERLVAVCENANYRMVAADVEACEQLHRVMTVASVLYRPSVFRIKGRSRVMFDLTVGYGKREDIISWKLPEDFRVVTRSGWFSDTVLVDQGEFLAAIMELRDVAATAEPVEVAYESYRA